MRPHRGVLILVFGILGFVICPFFGVAAWVMGNTDLREMNYGRMDPSGRDFTKAGRICGIISTVLLAVPMLLMILFWIGMLVYNILGPT